jgi:hypothetical protein
MLGLLVLAGSAKASGPDQLYEAAVPVKNQSPATRAAALKEVLRSVAIKVTGLDVIPNSFFQQPLRLEDLVQQFGYESRQRTQAGRPQLQLWAKLDAVGVKQLIRQAGLPIWPEERPATLVWLAVEDPAGRQILAEGSEHPALTLLNELAERRGLPVVLPLMDLQESSLVDFDVVSAMQLEPLVSPSDKYGSHYVLVGHLQMLEKGLWRGRWKLIGENEQVSTTPAGPLSDVLAAGINPLASRIAQQFSSLSYVDSEQYIDLSIDDINGAADYARSLKYLQSLSLISQVDVVGADQQMVNFRLHTKADMASVLQVIGLGRVLYARDTIDQLVFGLNP